MTINWTQEQYVKALRYATEAHCAINQKVPGTEFPYICHPVMVAMEVIAALPHHGHCEGNLAISCALLHDTIEDTKVTYEDLENCFGAKIAKGVLALSKNKELRDKSLQMEDSLARIREQPKEVWMVKLADRITNLMVPPAYWTIDKRKAYRQEAKLILKELGEGSEYMAERLKERIEAYGQYIKPD